MGPETSLFIVFTIALGLFLIIKKEYKPALSGRIAMSVMLLVIGTGHFLFTKGIKMMLPGFVPFKTGIVYATGILEFVAAIGLHVPKYRKRTATGMIVYFILILPTNVYAASIHLNEQTGELNDRGPESLWYRIPLQLVFIAWVYFSAVYKRKPVKQSYIKHDSYNMAAQGS